MAGNWGAAEEAELDRRNQMRTQNLYSKVSHLKSIAVDLEQESYEHNRLLDGVGMDFGSGDSLLGGSMNRLKGVLAAGSKNRKVTCYTCLGVVFTIVLFYYLLSSAFSSS